MTSELERECNRTPKVTITATFGKATEYRPDMPNNWRVVLHYQGRQLTTNFYGGEAVYDITAADVLSSLILDADAGERSFEEFAGDFGYDADSLTAYRQWEACRKSAPNVRKFLDDDWDRFANLEH